MFTSLLFGMVALPATLAVPRQAKFYEGDKCNDASRGPFEMKPATTDLDLPAEQCIALDGMRSFMPTIQPEEDTGSYCYLAFDDKRCDCIKMARLIVIDSNSTEVACETVEVADRHSYHFQLEDPDKGCPAGGCFSDPGSIKWAHLQQESQLPKPEGEGDKDPGLEEVQTKNAYVSTVYASTVYTTTTRT